MSSEFGDAVIFNGYGKPLVKTKFEIPKKVDDYDALVKVTLATICGSDVHTWCGHRDFPTPSILGHEIVGKIVKLGNKLQYDYMGNELHKGDRVVWSMTVSCGTCYFCTTAGLPQKCVNLFKYGHVKSDEPPHFTGGYAEFVYLKKGTSIFKIPSELTDEEVAPLMCAGATVMSGLDAADFSHCDYVVVQGCGSLGLYACAFTKELGASKVIAIDTENERLTLAQQFGADYLINATEDENDILNHITKITCGRGVDYVIEVTGSSHVIPQGIKFLRIGGKYILLGAIYPQGFVTIDSSDVITKCLHLFGMHNYKSIHLNNAIQLVQKIRKKYPFKKLVGPIFNLSEIDLEAAFNSLYTKKSIRPAIIPAPTSSSI